MDYKDSIIDMIKKVAKGIAVDEMTKLRIEEDLLFTLVKNPKQSLSIKSMAFKELQNINNKQLNILGQTINRKGIKKIGKERIL